MKAQIGDGMSGVRLYFDIRHNCNGRVVSGTRVTRLTPMEFSNESFRLEGGCTPGIMSENNFI